MQRKPKILIVDDDRSLVDTMCEILEEDFSVETAADGSEAVQKATRDRPDLVLMDVEMPNMNGYESCRLLREQPETTDVPIIMLTSRSEPDDASRAFEAGATDYLTKPFSISQLRTRTHTMLLRGGPGPPPP